MLFKSHNNLLFIIFLAIFSGCDSNSELWCEVKGIQTSPTARHECGFIEEGGKFYLLGGRGLKPVEIFDPASNTWTQGATPPVEIHHFQPISFNGYIVVLGAMTGAYPAEQPLSNMLVYQPTQDQWFVGDTIPRKRNRGSGGTVVYNNKFYWIGGIRNGHLGGHCNFLDEYNPQSKIWRILPDAPQARDHFQASVVEDVLFVAGGRRTKAPYGTFDGVISEVEVYDFDKQEWTSLEVKFPTPRAGTFNATYGSKVYIAGGEDPLEEYAHQKVEVYDWSKKKWISFPDIPTGRHGTGMFHYQGNLWTSCGSYKKGGGPELEDLWRIKI